jgi:hypothetical protein
MAVKLSAFRTDRPLPSRRFLVLISAKRLSRPQAHSEIGRISSVEFRDRNSKLRPSGYIHAASTNHATAWNFVEELRKTRKQ